VDTLVAARKLIAELVTGEQIEVRRAEIVGRDLAKLVETLRRPPSGEELETWLGEHAQVTELYASATELDELVFRHLVAPAPMAPAVEARHPELEAQLRADPGNTDLYLVYSDWLQGQGDPFGELIAYGVAKDETRFERHLKLHEERFLGPSAVVKNHMRWRNGMVQAIEGASLTPAAWRALLGLRICELLESLTFELGFSRGEREVRFGVEEAIAAHAATTLRRVELVSWTDPLPEQLFQRALRSLAIQSPATVALRVLPRSLERLELRVGELDRPLGERSIRELEIQITPRVAPSLRGAQLPYLERLVVVDCARGLELDNLLATMALPALRHFGLDGGELVALPDLPDVATIALTNLGLDDETIKAIVRACRSLPKLRVLDVSDNELSREGLALVRELPVEVISRRQHKRGSNTERRIRRFAGSRMHVAEEIAELKAWKHAGQDGTVRWARYRGEDEYELFISIDLQRYACTCPSSIQPCKHVVALTIVAERHGLPRAADPALVNRVLAQHPWLQA